MEQIRQLLSQMALNLELNIAMCDKLAELEGRVDKLDPILKSHTTKIDAMSNRIAKLEVTAASKAYESRTGEKTYK